MKHFIKYIYIYMFFIVLSLTIGFSAFNRSIMMRDIGAQIRIIKDIRVTGITPSGSTSNGLAMSEDYNVSNVTPSLSLPNSDSTVTYTVEVTNIGNAVMGIAGITGCPNNLVCEISDYTIGEPLCDGTGKCKLGVVKEIGLTIKYASGGYNSANTSYDLVLRFDFREFHNVTYINAPRGNNYKTYVMDGIEFTQGNTPAGGGFATYTASGTSVSGTNWNLTNKIVTVPADKVTEDITIRFRPLGEYINKLYTDGAKSTVNNGGTIGSSATTYNRVTSLGLINDKLGGRASSGDGGNVRYYSASANNYIYFNCSDYSNQSDSTCEKWRIIGVFNGKVKIIRNSSIGGYSIDTTKNKWVDSAMHKLLNSGYESEGANNSLYWNARSGKCYIASTTIGQAYRETDCDFTSTGLKSGDTKDFITTETIYFTSPTSALVNVGDLYHNEHGNGSIASANDRTWTGKVSLPYPSDYYYSTDLSTCTSNVFWLGSRCAATSWMTQNADMWTITPGASGSDNEWYINSSGAARFTVVPASYAILPTMYLYANTIFIDGDGSSGNPYKIYPLA